MKQSVFDQMIRKATKSVQRLNRQLAQEIPWRPWNQREDEILKAAYNGSRESGIPIDSAKLSMILDRPLAGIYCRAGELGISFDRGKYPRNPPKPYQSKATMTVTQRIKAASERVTRWHQTHPHPILGRTVPQSVRDKISMANKGRKVPRHIVEAGLRTRIRHGTMVPNRKHGSWRSGWRVIGMKRIFARSRWEANYARYLEFLRQSGSIKEWLHEPKTFWFEKIRRGTRSYLPDFQIINLDGSDEFHEVKGWMDPKSLTKIRRMKKYYPKVKLIVIDGQWFKRNQRQLRPLIKGWES